MNYAIEFVAMGKALGGGSGWVLLSWSPRDRRLVNQRAAARRGGGELTMRGRITRTAAFLGVLLAVSDFSHPARAQQMPDCKACAGERKICRQAHSQQACDSEYAMCIKYCARNSAPPKSTRR